MKAVLISLLLLFFSACSRPIDTYQDLSGVWKYHAGDNLEWKNPNLDEKDWSEIDIPGDLVKKLGDNGVSNAWLRTTYHVEKKPNEQQALMLGIIGDMDEVYIDGYLVGKTGEFPPDRRLAIHKYRSYLIPTYALETGTHTLAIRLVKWGGPGMGIVGSRPMIADYKDSKLESLMFNVIRSDLPFALSIFLLCMGLYLMLIYVTCKVEKQYFYSAIACISLMVYCLVDSWKITDSWKIVTNIDFVSFGMIFICICNYATFRFIRSASRKPFSKMDSINFWVTVFFVIAFPFMQNVTQLNLLITFWMPQVFFTNGYVGIQLYRNFKATRKISATVLFFSFMILMLCVAHDLYGQFFKPYLMVWISFGYFAFCLGISFFLAQDYSGAIVDQIETKKLIQKSEVLEEAIAKDALTGLCSRSSFMEMLDQEILKARNEGSSLTLAIMDIDHFKFYNDAYGHPSGDQLLRSLGWIIQKWTRTTDTCGRLGGEEFGILLRKTSLADAYRACVRLRRNVNTFPFEHMGKNEQHVTLSIGLVALSAQAPTSEKMYQEADRQLYLAKRKRNWIEPAIFVQSRIQEPRMNYDQAMVAR